LSEIRGFMGPGHLVSGADWMPGTARAPMGFNHYSDEAWILQNSRTEFTQAIFNHAVATPSNLSNPSSYRRAPSSLSLSRL